MQTAAAESGGAPNGWDRRRKRIATKLENTALELFAEHGFHHVTLSRIAETAGVSTRTLTRYFPSKEDLLLARPRRAHDKLLQALQGIAPGEADPTRIWATLHHVPHEGAESARTWYRAAASAPDVVARSIGERRLALQAKLVDMISACIGVDPDEDIRPHVGAAAIEATYRVGAEFWATKAADRSLPDVLAAATNILDSGLVGCRAPLPPKAAPDSAESPETTPGGRGHSSSLVTTLA